jgi:hypothetical protein
MEKIQTAVDWLIDNYLPLKRGIEVNYEHTIKVVEQAKLIEKHHIINSYKQGQIDSSPIRETDGEQYFNLIFKNK